MSRKLLGEIVEHEGCLSLQTAPRVWYPLDGNSGIAADFQEAFNKPQRSDIGRQLWSVDGVLQMESIEQRDKRLRDVHNPDTNPDWKPRVAWRVYACGQCGTEKQVQTNHTGTIPAERCAGKCRTILHAHTERETVLPYIGPHKYKREIR